MLYDGEICAGFGDGLYAVPLRMLWEILIEKPFSYRRAKSDFKLKFIGITDQLNSVRSTQGGILYWQRKPLRKKKPPGNTLLST